MRIQIVDPAAYTPPYDHALCTALAAESFDVELVTSHFSYGDVPAAESYRRTEFFYRHQLGAGGSRARQAARAFQHLPDMLRYRRYAQRTDLVHFQWLPVQQLDRFLLPTGRPVVLTAHDVLPREPRPGQLHAQRKLYGRVDAIVAHSQHSRDRLLELGTAAEKVHLIPHGAFTHLTQRPDELPLPAELAAVERPVVLFFGLLRPYKGLDVLLEAFREITDAELWIVGMPRMPLAPLQAAAGPNVRFIPRFIGDRELPAYFRRADLVVLPYRESEQSGVLYTALAFGRPLVLSDVGGFGEVAATGVGELVPPGEVSALSSAITALLADQNRRRKLSTAALAAAQSTYSWATVAHKTAMLYRGLL